ncbi:Receptor expression-enhancing protein 2 [Amphibalanus amphitrite]|uniref:Receptor expression-enhancing protein n=1 Tax=Amphibalanus amphitrite TaxID=1232801 RepID=A0A6A4W5B4_AMPAM|nr:Receptor expression-enhancing protein 2 [Amphibalanus amphitrite]
MLSQMFSRLVILVFGTLYPAFASYKAVRTKNIKEYVKWMMYWIVFAFFTCLETVTDLFLVWFPFYYEIKILLVIWLLSPVTRGSSILYKKFVHPWLERNENEIDQYIERASKKSYSTVMTLGVRGVNMATQMIMQTAIRGGGGIVDHLRRSYSVNDVADLAGGPDAGDFNSNRVKRLPQIVDVTEELDSDAEPVTFPMAGPSGGAAEAAAEPKRRPRRAATKPAVPRARATRKPRSAEREESDEADRPPPPAWEQAQSMEDISSGYNSGEPFYDAVTREDDDAALAGRRSGGSRAARARPPLHGQRASTRVKSSATTDVSGYATLPRRRASTRKPIPKYD